MHAVVGVSGVFRILLLLKPENERRTLVENILQSSGFLALYIVSNFANGIIL
jgi:hypothetical protein